MLLTDTSQLPENAIDTIRPDSPALAWYGPHPVGVHTLHLTDPDRIDVLASLDKVVRGPRSLTVEVWHPAHPVPGAGRGELHTVLRDGTTPIVLRGRGVRGAPPLQGPFPLVVFSHGYPGNRFLMAPLAENLASKGYVVASIDHTDSTYSDLGPFHSTLVNRSLDQLFVLNELTRLAAARDPLPGSIDFEKVALLGFSMGGYGVLNTVGAGLCDAAVHAPQSPPFGMLAGRAHSSPGFHQTVDPRIKAAIAVAPWGMNFGLWDAQGLASVQVPLFLIGGSRDDIAGYESGVRAIWQGTTGTRRHLLTFENANHNVAVPIPPPVESHADPENFKHYADPVWDTTRMNNITQHFVTAFLNLHLKGETDMQEFLQPAETWKGFSPSGMAGLRLEVQEPAVSP